MSALMQDIEHARLASAMHLGLATPWFDAVKQYYSVEHIYPLISEAMDVSLLLRSCHVVHLTCTVTLPGIIYEQQDQS